MFRKYKVVVASLFVGSCGFAGTLFHDTFENGQVENSDTVNGFWTFTQIAGEGATVTEDRGQLLMTSPRPNNQASSMLQSRVFPEVNFFTPAGITITADMSASGDTEIPQADIAVFFLSSSPGMAYKGGANDIFAVEFRRDTDVRVRTRLGNDSPMVNLRAIEIQGACGFTLVINESTYTLTINKTSGKPQKISGTHNLKAADWGNGGSAIGFMTVKGGKQAGKVSSVTADNLTISVSE